jgi:electron transfer flavoprotein beta subunit
MFVPEKKKGGLVLEGEVNELAGKLLQILKEKTTVLK